MAHEEGEDGGAAVDDTPGVQPAAILALNSHGPVVDGHCDRGYRSHPGAAILKIDERPSWKSCRGLSSPAVGDLLYLSRADVEGLLDVDALLDALGKALVIFSSGVRSVPARRGATAHGWVTEGSWVQCPDMCPASRSR